MGEECPPVTAAAAQEVSMVRLRAALLAKRVHREHVQRWQEINERMSIMRDQRTPVGQQ